MSHRKTILLLSLYGLFFSYSTFAQGPNYNLPLNRPYTLKNATPFVLEQEYHRLIQSGGSRSFIFPRSCQGFSETTNPCTKTAPIHFGDNDKASLNINLVSGLEYRHEDENVEALDFGLGSDGFQGPLSFYLDARMFVELHENYNHPSYDHEQIDRQDEEASESLSYTSYSRYRSNLNLDTDFGRITVARDALHWGPGLFHNLVFSQNSIPFNHLSYSSAIGPLKFISVYGRLGISTNDKSFVATKDARNLYAHRYEVSVTPNLLLGISEQLILYNNQDPFAFIPIVPLYITKGTQLERSNNGNIAFDVSYKLWNVWHFYSEFLIDDLQAPTALFNDFWGNKWGALAGVHRILNLGGFQSGLILEAARVEPWVYTHYKPDEAQTANLGYPMGNQSGPNSQNFTTKVYIRNSQGLYTSLQLDLQWKGTDLGSGLNDEISQATERDHKKFIDGVSKPDIVITPYVGYLYKGLALESSAEIGSKFNLLLRMQYTY